MSKYRYETFLFYWVMHKQKVGEFIPLMMDAILFSSSF
jgi:hypothetical protein